MIDKIELASDPGRATTERDSLLAFLGYFRSVLVRKAAGLDTIQLAATLGPSSLTIGGLVKHMAFVEDHWFHSVLLGNDYPEPWLSADWDTSPDWEFDTAPNHTPCELLSQFRASVARSDAAIASVGNVDTIAAKQSHGQPTSLRWILVHMIEEYGRHCGHADLIRESIDGETGD
jgi:uncharacterized damage-inducible protein DinB